MNILIQNLIEDNKFYILYSAFSFLLSYLSLYLLIPILKRLINATPNHRSSHIKTKPSGGGLSFVLFGTLFSSLAGDILTLISLPIALVSLIDDKYNIRSYIRFAAHVLTSILIINVIFSGTTLSFKAFISIPFLILLITGIINLTNFMDGMDGLVAGCMLIILSIGSLQNNVPLLPLVFALLGFLKWNWSPSKIFMGDIGSTFLGAVFAGIILKSSSRYDAVCMLLVSFPLLADSVSCIIRRFIKGDNIFKAHNLHIYQRLYKSGWSHSQVSTLYISGTALLGISYLNGSVLSMIIVLIAELILGIYLDSRIASPFQAE